MSGRDRDAHGRARQARPRDALGRPLPYGAAGVAPVSEEPMPPAATIAAARALLSQGRPFSAHEVYETRWKSAPAPERELWKGLAQLCVAITHAARGNAIGAERLLERGSARLAEYGGDERRDRYGLDLAAEIRQARHLVANGRSALPPSDPPAEQSPQSLRR